jgi:hypothetical protein
MAHFSPSPVPNVRLRRAAGEQPCLVGFHQRGWVNMKRILLASLALSAVVGVSACSKEEEQDAAPIPEAAPPPTMSPAPVTTDTTMRDTTTTTTHL